MIQDLKKVQRNSAVDFKYSLLIPTWNNLEYIKFCVASIRKNSFFTHQIVIVINEGKDGTLAWVESQPDLDYVYSAKNLGICYGLNVCRSLIQTNYVVYLNDDMYLLPEWDKALNDEILVIGHHNFILSGTMIEPTNTGNPCVVVKDYGNSIENFQEALLLSEFETLIKEDWFGSTWPPIILPVNLWDLVGGMSIEFSPGMYSDPDLSMKLWIAGVRIFKGVGKSKVYHFGSKSTKRVKKNKGSDTFLMKWGMTSGSFVKTYLKRGDKYLGELPEPEIGLLFKWKNKFKRMKRC